MPDPFKGLLVVAARAGRVADDAGIQQAVTSQRQTKVHELLAPVAGVTAQDEVIGHVVCTRAHVDETPVLALGPLSVRPDRQRTGVGSALMHAVLGAGDALGEPMVVLLGDPGYYHRFGFLLASDARIRPPVAGWQPYFQVRTFASYQPTVRGAFRYAEPFDRT